MSVIPDMTDEEIRQAIVTDETEVGNGALLCSSLSTIPTDKIRYVIGLFIFGDGATSVTCAIQGGTYAATGSTISKTYFNAIPVQPAANVQLPQGGPMNPAAPLFTQSGATYPNIIGTVSGTTVHVTTVYFDTSI